jgi:glucosamine 6-phosphate synthetase-like amidotransferase/phosphosugar isomerase protein
MCAIVGIQCDVRDTEWGTTHSLMTQLLIEAAERGVDACGFAASTEPYDAPHKVRIVTDKAAVPSPEFVRSSAAWRRLRHQRCRAVLGHTRAACSGSATDPANAHPHHGIVGARRFSLVHNGWFTNVDDILRRHDLTMRTTVDSECAARLIERVGSIPEGMYRCLAELRGAQALAVLDHRTGTTYLCRDEGRPLWICRLRDRRRVIYGSTPNIIARAVEHRLGRFGDWVGDCHPLAPGFVYALTTELRLFTVFSTPARLEGVGEPR